jgi:hypothetical protein
MHPPYRLGGDPPRQLDSSQGYLVSQWGVVNECLLFLSRLLQETPRCNSLSSLVIDPVLCRPSLNLLALSTKRLLCPANRQRSPGMKWLSAAKNRALPA